MLCMLTIILCANIAVYAQGNAVLRFIILSEEDGTPLVGANVIMSEAGNEEILYNCVTNTDGFCEIRDIAPARDYLVKISYVGFENLIIEVNPSAGSRDNYREYLKPQVSEYDEVIVKGEREITTGEAGIRRISSTDISRIPTPGVDGDLVSYIQTIPGVVTAGDRGGDLHIRGGTPAQNLILVDNLPIVKPFHISNIFSAFSEEVVQNTDIYAGGFGAEFSGAASAVIDIKLRPGNMRSFRAGVGLSPYLTSVHMEGPIKKDRQSILFMGRKSIIEQVAPHIINDEILISFSDMLGRYTAQAENITCSITGIYTNDSGETIPLRQLRHSWTNTVVGARCLGYDPQFNYPLEVSAGYSNFVNKEGSFTETERYSSLNQMYINAHLQQEFMGIPFDYGFGLNFYNFNIELDEKYVDQQSQQETIPIFDFFVLADWSLSSWLTIQPGITSQIILENATIEPRFRVSIQPDGNERQELSFAAGKYVQYHAGISDQRDIGSVFTILQPVKDHSKLPTSLHGLAAYQHRLNENFIANFEAFVKSYENLPVSKWTAEARTELETANAEGISYGFDVRIRFIQNRLFASIGYGYSFVEYEASSGDLGAWVNDPIFSFSPAHDQRHKLNTIMSYNFGNLKVSARWELGSGRPYTQIYGFDFELPHDADPTKVPGTPRAIYARPFTERLPYYHRLDISIEKNFTINNGWQIETGAGVINVYNRRNVFNYDLNTLQRVDQSPIFPYFAIKLAKF